MASSDRPVTSGAPLTAIQFMVTRTSTKDLVIGPDEGIGVEEALRAHTIEAARACHWENAVGSLEPGKLADLVVLADDPRTVDAAAIGDIPVRATWLAGELVHGEHGELS